MILMFALIGLVANITKEIISLINLNIISNNNTGYAANVVKISILRFIFYVRIVSKWNAENVGIYNRGSLVKVENVSIVVGCVMSAKYGQHINDCMESLSDNGMVKSCAGLCLNHFSKITRKSLEKVSRKRDWLKCSKCEIYVKFGRIKIFLCPCCHNFLKRDLRSRNIRRRNYYHNYYMKNRERIRLRQMERDTQKRFNAAQKQLVLIRTQV